MKENCTIAVFVLDMISALTEAASKVVKDYSNTIFLTADVVDANENITDN